MLDATALPVALVRPRAPTLLPSKATNTLLATTQPTADPSVCHHAAEEPRVGEVEVGTGKQRGARGIRESVIGRKDGALPPYLVGSSLRLAFPGCSFVRWFDGGVPVRRGLCLCLVRVLDSRSKWDLFQDGVRRVGRGCKQLNQGWHLPLARSAREWSVLIVIFDGLQYVRYLVFVLSWYFIDVDSSIIASRRGHCFTYMYMYVFT
jgi:hypothetical protein